MVGKRAFEVAHWLNFSCPLAAQLEGLLWKLGFPFSSKLDSSLLVEF